MTHRQMVIIVAAMVVAFGLGMLVSSGVRDAPSTATATAHATEWTCSMHPQVRQPEAGACPLCGMDLIALDSMADVAEGKVVLSERARALARLRTTTVARQSDASVELRLLGRVEPDETTRRNVTTWIGGRIDRLHINVTGEQIQRGQVMATLYSPDVYSAHQDLLTAQQQVARLEQGSPATRQAAMAALEAAQARLRLLGVPERELEKMAQESSPRQSIEIRSPFQGTVIERVATEGAYLDVGAPLYRLSDLSTLWVQLDAYEQDLSRLAVGQEVSLAVEALPGVLFAGQVAFIDPTLDASRRTSRVRVQVDNPSGQLRPGMFAEAVVLAPSQDSPLVIPATAPLFTGRRSIVYVETAMADGRRAYEPRTVRLGTRLGEVYPVVAGLSEGERVVSRGAFAIDADLQIQGGQSMMSAPDDRGLGGEEPTMLSAAQRRVFAPVVQAYLDVQTALAADDLPAAQQASDALVQAVTQVQAEGAAEMVWDALAADMRTPAAAIGAAENIEGARAAFEGLSVVAERLLRQLGNPLSTPVRVAHCPMAMGSDGARWLQRGEEIDNAYFGATMRRCGEIVAEVESGMYLSDDLETGATPGHAGHAH